MRRLAVITLAVLVFTAPMVGTAQAKDLAQPGCSVLALVPARVGWFWVLREARKESEYRVKMAEVRAWNGATRRTVLHEGDVVCLQQAPGLGSYDDRPVR